MHTSQQGRTRRTKMKLLLSPLEIAFTDNRNPSNEGQHVRQRLLPATAALALLCLVGCRGPHPLHGGKAVTGRFGPGNLQQTLAQGDNPAQSSRQTQATVRVRSYTLPA